jgi:hypothetical protein
MTNEGQTGPGYGEHITGALAERGASPFEAARYARLPIDAQIVGMIRLDGDPSLDVRTLLDELEAEVERRAK